MVEQSIDCKFPWVKITTEFEIFKVRSNYISYYSSNNYSKSRVFLFIAAIDKYSFLF